MECGIAAIKHGADALYIGTSKFGARTAVGNSLTDIEQLIREAHLYKVKVYVTLNTILTNDAIKEAEKLIWQLSEIGIDGLIVQDLGLLECKLPPVPLIASTQTTNILPEYVLFLEKIGFKRVILERAISLEQIKQIRSKTTVEMEAFVHGSICVSYSGKCFLSYAHGKRSANLGVCAQPCRKNYSLADVNNGVIVKDRYLLSIKDLNLSSHLEELLEAGVTSFKIEGRLKGIDYVSNVTAYYRNELDKVLNKKCQKKASSGQVNAGFEPNLSKSFNRGFTDYFIYGEQNSIASTGTPKSLGEKIGIIGKVNRKYFTLITQHTIQNGDGICFINEYGDLVGTRINKIENGRVYPEDTRFIKSGMTLYRNYDAGFLKVLKNNKTERKISINLNLKIIENLVSLEVIDEDQVKTTSQLKTTTTKANQNNDQKLEECLNKLGNTIYTVQNIVINSNNFFIPIKKINVMRREAMEKHTENRLKSYVVETKTIQRNDVLYPVKSLDFSANVLNRKAMDFYKNHGVETIENAAESGTALKNKALMTMSYCVLKELDLCLKENNLKQPLYLIDDRSRRLRLNFNCNTCQMQVMGNIIA